MLEIPLPVPVGCLPTIKKMRPQAGIMALGGRDLYYACNLAKPDAGLGRARRLIKAGADVECALLEGTSTPLFAAASKGSTRVCEVLIKIGAAVWRQRRDGVTAFHASSLQRARPREHQQAAPWQGRGCQPGGPRGRHAAVRVLRQRPA